MHTYIDSRGKLISGWTALQKGFRHFRNHVAKGSGLPLDSRLKTGQIFSRAKISNRHVSIVQENVTWVNIVMDDALYLKIDSKPLY